MTRPHSQKTRVERAHKQLGIPSPICRFCLLIGGEIVYRVLIFETRGKLRKYIEYRRPDKPPTDIASAYAFTDEQNNEVLFCLYTCTDNNVSHEMFHATMLWAIRRSFKPVHVVSWGTVEHETLAEIHGDLVSQFWRRFCKRHQRIQCWGFESKEIEA